MKQFKYRIIFVSILFVFISCAAIVVYFVFGSPHQRTELTLYGNVDVRLVDMGFRVAGRVEEIYYEEGDFVQAGDLLARLDVTPYLAELNQARALEQSIQAQFENAVVLLKRRAELISRGAVSQEDLDNAYMRRDQLYADLLDAAAKVKASEDQLSYTEVYAPTDGIILTRVREPGSVVNPSDPVYTLSVSSPVWIRAYVDEPNLGDIDYGMEGYIYTDVRGAPVYKGKIGFISPISEFTPKTVQTTSLRTDLVYRLRLYVDNPDSILKQGMPVTIKIPLKKGR